MSGIKRDNEMKIGKIRDEILSIYINEEHLPEKRAHSPAIFTNIADFMIDNYP